MKFTGEIFNLILAELELIYVHMLVYKWMNMSRVSLSLNKIDTQCTYSVHRRFIVTRRKARLVIGRNEILIKNPDRITETVFTRKHVFSPWSVVRQVTFRITIVAMDRKTALNGPLRNLQSRIREGGGGEEGCVASLNCLHFVDKLSCLSRSILPLSANNRGNIQRTYAE